ncbi:hypothetical protein GTO87_08265 [Ligilactobacillus saerimneri]|uniref:YSIRK-type signal peptide-containing protein n=1 Tax=Ligilactobacillus saerimneri TaxID=228229 RepID=A0A7H9EMQ1_9LACO|nr:hypothetical protein [Ligilactobacillus saerimneri]QLL78577.1 hypothetical protein GTO87_08265 [Ligilactobacillus saerimneri]
MLSYKNVYEKTRKYSDSKQRFSIHRVGLVTVSVLVGLVCLGGHGTTHGDVVMAEPTVATTTTDTTINDDAITLSLRHLWQILRQRRLLLLK